MAMEDNQKKDGTRLDIRINKTIEREQHNDNHTLQLGLVMLAAVALVSIIAIGVSRYSGSKKDSQFVTVPETKATQDGDSSKLLQEAISAAFPNDKPLKDVDGVEWTFKVHRLVEAPFGPVLISEAEPNPDTVTHVTSGRMDVTYLLQFDEGFSVNRRYPSAVTVGSFGGIGEWAVVRQFSDHPMIFASGGFTGQGVTEGCAVLVDLTPNGPREVVAIPDYLGETGGEELKGKIENVIKSASFDVRYRGRMDGETLNIVKRYVWSGDRYVRQGAAVLYHCGEQESN